MFGGKHNCVAVIVIVHPQPRGRLNPCSSCGLKQLGGVSGIAVRGIVASGCRAAPKPSGPIGRCLLGGRGGGDC